MTQEQKEALLMALAELDEIAEMVGWVKKMPGVIKAEKFLWCCVDVAGLLAMVYPDSIGAKHATIRGFQVIRAEPFEPEAVRAMAAQEPGSTE